MIDDHFTSQKRPNTPQHNQNRNENHSRAESLRRRPGLSQRTEQREWYEKTISNKSLMWPLCTVEMLAGIINIRELCSFVTNKNGVNSLFISHFVLFFSKLKQVLSALPGPAQTVLVRLKFHPRSLCEDRSYWCKR